MGFLSKKQKAKNIKGKPMIIYNQKVFVHLNKCAGTSIINYMKLPENRQNINFWYSLHYSYNYIAEAHKNFPAFSLVRNPITWYESVYNYELSFLKRGNSLGLFNLLFATEPKIWKICSSQDVRKIRFRDIDIVSLDEFIERSLNFREFIERPEIELKIKEFLLTHTINTFKTFFFNINLENENNEIENTLYEFFITRYGINKTTFFRMEDELEDFCKTFQIEYNALPRSNIQQIKKHKINKTLKKKIIQKEFYLFDLLGYQ
jgi:hypothetical protein